MAETKKGQPKGWKGGYMKAIKRTRLAEMPFDKYNDEDGFVHATGDIVTLEDGTEILEYEDCIFDDADNCIYEDEDTSLEE